MVDGEQAERRREQLITNAWVQRAAEALASEEVYETRPLMFEKELSVFRAHFRPSSSIY